MSRIIVYRDGVQESETVVPDHPEAVASDAVRAKLRTALASNAAYLAIATPTAAQRNQQVDRLTRQVQALARLTLRELADTTDT